MIWFYIAAFGAPLVGIGVVLWMGNHLVAPPAIGGNWTLAITTESKMNRECLEEFGWAGPTTLHVNQSGNFLTLSFPVNGLSTISGRVKDLVITTTSPEVAYSNEVAGDLGHVTSVTADVQRNDDDQTQLTGLLVIAGCDEPVTFTATDRVPFQNQNSRGGH
jgi:hypothetical protein